MMIKSLSNRLKSIPGVSRYAEEYSKLDRVGEGTFGEVHKAVRQSTKELVALKKIRMETCSKDGQWERTDFPFTAVREIKLLKQLKHPNIISVIDMAVEAFGPHQNDKPEIYLVFPYMEGDLCGILDDPRVILDMGTIKAYMQQLLDGLHYLHYNNIIHRDLKSANILLNNRGELRIADFGLARQYEPVRRPEMTAVVVTRWYRAPELLLGIRRYTVAIDMWAFGCILAEMITRKPLFPGQDLSAGQREVVGEIGQLKLIYEYCGAPTDLEMDEIMQGEQQLREAAKIVERTPYYSSRSLIQHLRAEFVKSSTKAERLEDRDNLIQLIDSLLVHVPSRRPAAHECLKHAFFAKGVPVTELYRIRPLPGDIHEVDARRRSGAMGPSAAAAASHRAEHRNVNGPHQPLPPHQPHASQSQHGYHSNPYQSHPQHGGPYSRTSHQPGPPLPASAHGSSSGGCRPGGDPYRDSRDGHRDYRRRSRSPTDHPGYHPRNMRSSPPPPPVSASHPHHPPPPPPPPPPASYRQRGAATSTQRGYSRERSGNNRTNEGGSYLGGYDDRWGPSAASAEGGRDRARSRDRPGPNLSLPPTPAAHPTPPRPLAAAAPPPGPETISVLADRYGVQGAVGGVSTTARDVGHGPRGHDRGSHASSHQRGRGADSYQPGARQSSRPSAASHPSLPSKPPLPPIPGGGAGARTSGDRVTRNMGLPRAPSLTMSTSTSAASAGAGAMGDGVWGTVGPSSVGGSSERERERDMPPSMAAAAGHANGGGLDRAHRDRPNPWASTVGVGASTRREQ